VDGRSYPIVDDVIILLEPSKYPDSLRKRIGLSGNRSSDSTAEFADDIQFTFGEEWQSYPEILPEHEEEYRLYFDIVDDSILKDSRVCDLGCGIGRWSYFVKDKCREMVLVDFSEAIFVARRNLKDSDNIMFFMGDLKCLPFRESFADFLFCLGVLHHLPTEALGEVRRLKQYASTLLIYLYYSLDNKPVYFRALLGGVTLLRLLVSKVKNPLFRSVFSAIGAVTVYLPLVWLGHLLSSLGLSRYVPLYEGYKNKSQARIRQDVYDRFFTRIEQRYSRKEITKLRDTFDNVAISDNLPYWHFICSSIHRNK
jgi:ubiquinone/menaquinone biosynthesis C-methylase UbiE